MSLKLVDLRGAPACNSHEIYRHIISTGQGHSLRQLCLDDRLRKQTTHRQVILVGTTILFGGGLQMGMLHSEFIQDIKHKIP